MSVTDSQYAAFVDRVVACREAEDRAKEDTKQLYAEIAEAGEDKTAIGIIVRGLRLTAKEKAKAQFREAAVEDGLERYRRGKASHVRAREAGIRHDADGVIIEDQAETPNEAALAPVAARQAGEEVRASSAANSHPVANVGEGANGAIAAASVDPASREADGADRQQPATSGITGEGEGASAVLPTNSEPQPTAAQTGGPSSLPASVAGPEAVESPAANSVVGIPTATSEPREGAPGRSGDSEPPAHDPAPVDHSKPNPWCLDQEECGLSSWEYFCMRCQRVKAEREAVGAVQ